MHSPLPALMFTLSLLGIGCTPLSVLETALNQPQPQPRSSTQVTIEQPRSIESAQVTEAPTQTKQRDTLAKANAAFDKADYVTALNLYESLRYTPRENEGLYLRLAEIHQQQGNDSKYLKTLEEAKTRIKGSAQIHNQLGVYYTNQKDLVKAEAEFKMAHELAADDRVMQINLAHNYYQQNKFSLAESLLTPLLAAGEIKTAAEYGMVGLTYLNRAKYEEARQTYERSLAAHPHNMAAYVGLIAYYQVGQNDFEKALETYNLAFAHADQTQSPLLHNSLGALYLGRRDYTKALEQFEQLPADYPDRASLIEQASNPRLSPINPFPVFIIGPGQPDTTPQATVTPTGEPAGGKVSFLVDPYDGNIDYGAGPASIRFALRLSDQRTPPDPIPFDCLPVMQGFILKTRNGLSSLVIGPDTFRAAKNETLYFSYLGAPVDFPFEIGLSPAFEGQRQAGFNDKVVKGTASLNPKTITVDVPVRAWPAGCFR